MSSTYSSLLRIELPGTGEQSGTWGTTLNTDLGTLIEKAIAGTATVDVSGGNVTLTSNNGTDDQSRCAIIRVIGTPGTSRNVIAPISSKLYVVKNGSDAAIVFKGAATTGITIPTGLTAFLYYDTTTADFAIANGLLAGGATISDAGDLTLDGGLNLDGDIVVATNKFVVDSGTGDTDIAGALDVTGAVGITGDVTVGANKVVMDSATGNSTVAGTLAVTGALSSAGMDNDLSASGYTTLVDGTVMQWGAATIAASGATSGTQSVSYPVAFPTGALRVLICGQTPTTPVVAGFSASSAGASSFTLGWSVGTAGQMGGGTVVTYLAIGH